MDEPETVLLSGVTGSHAYGLATPESDVDRLGVWAAPTEQILSLHPPAPSVVRTDPDAAYHEAGKMIRLLLTCNPTVTELLWLPDELYDLRSELGSELISLRRTLLSRERVRNACLGYAQQQFTRLRNRGDGSFSADTRRRTAKHARHLARLCAQGFQLYADGELTVRLENPAWFLDFGDQVAEGNIELAERHLEGYKDLFDRTASVLPGRPDESAAESWLQRVRREFY